MGFFRFWLSCFWKALPHSLGKADNVTYLATIFIGGLVLWVKSLPDKTIYPPFVEAVMSLTDWQIATGVLATVFFIRLLLAPYWMYKDIKKDQNKLQTQVDNQNQGQGLLNQLERLYDVWSTLMNVSKDISDESEFEQWKAQYMAWRDKAKNCTEGTKAIHYTIYKLDGYNEEHISLQIESTIIRQDIERKISEVKTTL